MIFNLGLPNSKKTAEHMFSSSKAPQQGTVSSFWMKKSTVCINQGDAFKLRKNAQW